MLIAYCHLTTKDMVHGSFECSNFEYQDISEDTMETFRNSVRSSKQQANGEWPENDEMYEKIFQLDMWLQGSMSHTRRLALLLLHLYGDVDTPGGVEKWHFDFVDTENKIMAEVGQVQGTTSRNRITHMFNFQVMRFLVREGIGERRDWDFYCLTYGFDKVIKCIPTEEAYQHIEDNLER